MLSDFLNVKDLVNSLIKQYPELKENDTLLYLAVLNKKYYLRLKIGVQAYEKLKEVMLEAPKFESVSRARRKAVEKNTSYAIKEEHEMRGYFRNENKIKYETS